MLPLFPQGQINVVVHQIVMEASRSSQVALLVGAKPPVLIKLLNQCGLNCWERTCMRDTKWCFGVLELIWFQHLEYGTLGMSLVWSWGRIDWAFITMMHICLGDIKIDAIQVDSPLHLVKTLVVFPNPPGSAYYVCSNWVWFF